MARVYQLNMNNGNGDKREVVDRIFADWLDKKTTKGLNFNDALYGKRDFYNPGVTQTLLEYAGLEECKSNLAKDVFDDDNVPMFDYERVSANQRREYEESNNRSNKR